ncbi:hypothetical protein C2869_16955 [Saccharobesus litoralis]|uniref:Uncharacterized protein n=1 Tax=Saccharobesus litoralis TaxID=2172099 RepID=A0A2S0VUX0_9ALTE|nr:hypothetical protein [Saccharobesus litoralis]AWB68009.1 hypothetical protein C2869_16955 [Saccharobesus litoralis]
MLNNYLYFKLIAIGLLSVLLTATLFGFLEQSPEKLYFWQDDTEQTFVAVQSAEQMTDLDRHLSEMMMATDINKLTKLVQQFNQQYPGHVVPTSVVSRMLLSGLNLPATQHAEILAALQKSICIENLDLAAEFIHSTASDAQQIAFNIINSVQFES